MRFCRNATLCLLVGASIIESGIIVHSAGILTVNLLVVFLLNIKKTFLIKINNLELSFGLFNCLIAVEIKGGKISEGISHFDPLISFISLKMG